MLEPVYLVRDFLETGGRVLVFILVTTFLMFALGAWVLRANRGLRLS